MHRIIYFSGTGNTAYIAGIIESRLDKNGVVAESVPLELSETTNLNDLSCLYIGFPVYACDMPELVSEFIEAMPEGVGTETRLFCTKAFFSGKAMARAVKRLSARGYKVVSTAEFKMPGSDGLAFLRKDGSAAQKLAANVPHDFSGVDSLISSGSDAGLNLNSFDPFGMILGGLLKLAENGLKKKYYADARCIFCGRCASRCPTGNIKAEKPEVVFDNKCILCMRCIHQCPVEAIQIGKSTVNRFRYKGPDGNYRPPRLR